MDRFLKPDKLDTDPGAENAENQWTYWKVTFDNFVATFTGDAVLSNEAKKAALINCVSPSVYTGGGGEPMTTNGDFWGLMGTKIHGDSRSNR